MNAIAEYFRIVVEDGDWANDWLTHLPEAIRSLVELIGFLLALVLGS